jgi:hypothetical protein
MPKHHLLVLLGVLALVAGVIFYAQTDTWTRSWAQITLIAGSIFFAVGLGTWEIVDTLRQRRE